MYKKIVFIIDDDETYIQDLSNLLNSRYKVLSETNPDQAITNPDLLYSDIVILDLNLGNNKFGIDYIPKISSLNPLLPIIIVSSYEQPRIIVDALKAGAVDYIHKSLNIKEIEHSFEESIAQINRLKIEKFKETERKKLRMVFVSDMMKRIYEEALQVAASDLSVLISGESGVGKGLLAKIIHDESNRFNKNFVTIHTPSLNENLFESELFGVLKGAYTGAIQNKIGKVEYADGGTLLLDEVTETPLVNQAKLLRLVEDKEYEKVGSVKTKSVDIRILSTTNRTQEEIFDEKMFRKDLYYRLSAYQITIPPLRKRTEDILPIADFILFNKSKNLNKNINGFTKNAQELLRNYSWPGNTRELINIIERAIIRSNGNLWITESIIRPLINIQNDSATILPYHDEIKTNQINFKRQYVTKLLKLTNGKISKAASIAQIPRQSLIRITKEVGISANTFKM